MSSIRIATPAQVDFHHALVLMDLVHRPLAEHLALVQYSDLSSDVAHELHVMLDDQHRALLSHRLQQPARLLRLLARHARHRLSVASPPRTLHHSHPEPYAPL